MARWGLRVLAAFTIAAAAISVHARQQDASEDLDQLHAQFWELLPRGRLAEAEQVARRMIEIGRHEWKNNPQLITQGYLNFADLLLLREKYAESEKTQRQAIDILRKYAGEDDGYYAWALAKLAENFSQQGRYAESEPIAAEALARLEKAAGALDGDVTTVRIQLAATRANLGKFDQAEKMLSDALAQHRRELGADKLELAPLHLALAELFLQRFRFADSQRSANEAIRLLTAAGEDAAGDLSSAQLLLARVKVYQGQFKEAEELAARCVAADERLAGNDSLALLDGLLFHALCARELGRYSDAEKIAQRALDIAEKAVGPDHTQVAAALGALTEVYLGQFRAIEAQSICARAVAMLEKIPGRHPGELADALLMAAEAQGASGRFSEAEEMLDRVEGLRREQGGDSRADLADLGYYRARLLEEQHRIEEALASYQETWQRFSDLVGEDYPRMGSVAVRLGACCLELRKLDDAQQWVERALKLQRSRLGSDHPDVADSLAALAEIRAAQGRFDEADKYYQEALALFTKVFGRDSGAVADLLVSKAEMLLRSDRVAAAEPLADRAIELLHNSGRSPGAQAKAYYLRARLSWQAGHQSEAVADLRRTLDLAEQQRGRSAGAEQERASLFGSYAEAFETMVQWQLTLGDVSEALAAIERSRARSLLDELSRPGVDLLVNLSAQERERLRGEESELEARVSAAQAQVRDAKQADRPAREQELAAARDALYDHFRAVRSASPVYRTLLASSSGTLRLSQVRSRVVGEQSLLLVYLLGKQSGYVLSIGPDQSRETELRFDDAAAKALGVDPGPLSAERLRKALMNAENTGVLQQLADPKAAVATPERLHALWLSLVPEAERQAILDGSLKRLIVVPDGPLALLPIEALVTSLDGESPKYLLDAGPPVLYGPSASVLYNLQQRSAPDTDSKREPVLTVGDPAYEGIELAANRGAPRPTQPTLREPLVAARYRGAGGELSRLPFSGTESQWVATVFKEGEMASVRLLGPQATEARLRGELPDRQIVHLACHGLTDQAHGNFFGSLALAPGPAGTQDPADNGFLTLAEIYELNLGACELAILSACQTNYGPEQEGEGVWGLSRGFLVAGARRVVASNWLVDDEAAAHLMSHFCRKIAVPSTGDQRPDYASAMQAAKRAIRQQEKWRSPYFWATFVLVGPD